ncbi:MAG: hypothetical protein QM601_06460 [Pseudoxanthomonas sp.]
MDAQNKIKRHGYHLMSLASVGMFCVGLLTWILMMVPWMPNKEHLNAVHWKLLGFDLQEFVRTGAHSQWELTLSALCVGTACFLPFRALRHLGYSLYRNEALTLPVAKAFRRLAHSILIGLLLQGLPDFCMGFVDGLADGYGTPGAMPTQYVPHGFGIAAIYIAIIACLCLYSVAHLMKLAAEADADARSIV